MHEYNPSSCWGSVMVWGMFSWHDLGPLIRVEQCLNNTTYLSIIADQVHPIRLMPYPNGDGFFQQDNGHATVLILCRSGFKNMRVTLSCLGGPHNHKDLNPIDLLWDEVKRATRQLVPQPSNLTELDSAIHQAWCQVPRSPFNISWSQCQEESPQY
uniref:Uncharacterized protein n=1 Tax=Myotis myotis TaxID=51298 RepID=A0A7J7XHJ2_MYOMY|nr:hypothetical protein mMyoMyo1_011705 [Myotis myotis]